MLAIGRGLMAEPRLLILDEPSLGLSPLLVEELFALIRRINAEGIAAAAGRAERGKGRFALTGTAAEIAADPRLKRAYLGCDRARRRRSLGELFPLVGRDGVMMHHRWPDPSPNPSLPTSIGSI